MDEKFKQIYYSDVGYWRGKSAIQKLPRASGSTKEEAKNGYGKNHCTKYIYHHQNAFLGPMQACHYLLHQTISIRQIFFIYLMTDTKGKHISML